MNRPGCEWQGHWRLLRAAVAMALIWITQTLPVYAHGCSHSCGHSFSHSSSFHSSFSHSSFSHSSFSHSSFSHSSFSHSSFPHSSFSHSSFTHSSSFPRFNSHTTITPGFFSHYSTVHERGSIENQVINPNCSAPGSAAIVTQECAPVQHCGLLGHLHRFFVGHHNVVVVPPVQVPPIVTPSVPATIIVTSNPPRNHFTGIYCNRTTQLVLPPIITWLLPPPPPTRYIEEEPTDSAQMNVPEENNPEDSIPQMDNPQSNNPDQLSESDLVLDTTPNQPGQPVFKEVSYLLPSADGVLAVYFANENPSISRFVQDRSSFLGLALSHLSNPPDQN